MTSGRFTGRPLPHTLSRVDTPPRPATQLGRRAVLGAGLAGLGATACGSVAAPIAERAPEQDELLAALADQSHTGEPITAEERAERRTRLGRILARAGTDALLVEPSATMDYLTGVSWGLSERLFALVVLADGSHFWLSPAFERPKAEKKIAEAGGDVATWDEHEYAFAPLASALRERGVSSIAIEPRCRFFVADGLAGELGSRAVRSGHDATRELRARKDAHELALLRRASELTQQAIVAASEHLREGMTGADVAGWMRRAQERLGLTDVWVLALFGKAAAFPHGEDRDVPLARGDVILVDTGGTFHGYRSDTTRTWVFGGRPSSEVERVWNVVRDAQARAFDVLRPGVPCREPDRVARSVIEDAGFGAGYESFTHRLGHGIGLEVHEEPYLDGGNELPLAPGMTFSDEPGIYLYGRFGIRLEDIVAITADGAESFGTWQRSPASPA